MFLTVSQAAEYLGRPKDAIRKYFDDGVLEGYREQSGHRRISMDSLTEFRSNPRARIKSSAVAGKCVVRIHG